MGVWGVAPTSGPTTEEKKRNRPRVALPTSPGEVANQLLTKTKKKLNQPPPFSPSLGSPSYNVAADNATYFGPVAAAWGLQYAQLSTQLVTISAVNEGALQFLVTNGHTDAAAAAGQDWDVTVAGALDDVAVTLIAGDYCSTTGCGSSTPPLTDGTVGLYSQLVQPCPGCGPPPVSVYVPPNYVPPSAVRKIFPTVHSAFVVRGLQELTGQPVPDTLAADKNPDVIQFVVDTVAAAWQRAGVPVRG